ncbi:E3 ubiquitin-protein ligase arih1l [Cryptotermes secundus]|uniref:RBR-type E3 ubiquitin transferase n=1 Tax=Cryptotermes secundus TaxID=105785 RepID=A0A2J7QVS4_9NEOP|nr:potential E3 ubiquitin-protein ligase ariadne-1 [Cryptotermes secundus]PNF32672.1 E3 ubiquitin-protein ligase arih1l [Cryptotermes secundus]
MDSEEETFYDEFDSGNESRRADDAYDDDDDDVLVEAESSNSTKRQTEMDEYPFEVLSTDEIVDRMVDSIRQVNIIMDIPETTARILLSHFKWDKEMLMDSFYGGDQDKLFAEAHLINPFRKPAVVNGPEITSPRSTSDADTEECEICFMVVPSPMMTGLECGHRFCTQCLVQHLTTKIMDQGIGQSISCAAHGCDILVDDATVMRLIRDSKVKLRYQRLITNNFVACSRLLRWCPSPGCNNAIKVHFMESRPVTCKCSHTFCIGCGENCHEPIKCDLLRKWTRSYNGIQSFNWISINTKDCPKCNAPIQKIDGCNFIVCRNIHCDAEFCWECLRLTNSHFHCSDRPKNVQKEAEKANAEKEAKYVRDQKLFYSSRYMNHKQSLKFEEELYDYVERKMKELQPHDVPWCDVNFLKETVDILLQCRQTLIYTYVFAYYARKNNQFLIFEENQRDLEIATKILLGYLKRDITPENVADIGTKLSDKCIYCDKRRKVLVEHVHEGYEKNWWEFTE